MTKNPRELKDHIMRRLGAPVVNIEVTEQQIFDCIDRSLELYGEYHYDGVNRAYKVFNIQSDEDYANGVFDLSDQSVFAVTKVLRTNVGSITSLDGSATYPWVTDFVMGLTKFGNQGCSSFGGNSFGSDLGYFTQIQQYWGLMQNMMSPIPDFWYNDATGQLKLMGNFRKGDLVIVEVYVKSYVDVDSSVNAYAGTGYAGQGQGGPWSLSDRYNDPSKTIVPVIAGETRALNNGAYNVRWVKDYATTLTKEVLGQVLAKHQGMQLPGGVTVDGLRLLEEARYEKEQLRQELDLLDPCVPILIG